LSRATCVLPHIPCETIESEAAPRAHVSRWVSEGTVSVETKANLRLPAGTRVEIRPGEAAWEQASPLFDAVWPPEVYATFSWAHVVWAHAELRVLVWNGMNELVCHVGVYLRQAKWADREVRIGGIGGVITREDARKQGHASTAIRLAVAEMRDAGGADFALLVCEPHNFAFYRGLGWRQFTGDLFCEQPGGRVCFDAMTPFVFDLRLAPQGGAIDLCGLPW
jgi:aminoglycoside 2'-N-acetyltransferase I